MLAVVIQLAFVLTPMMEGREERVLGSHVEAPRTTAHPGHHPDWCPVCQMLSVHGLAPSKPELPDFPAFAGRCSATYASHQCGVERTQSNGSRAPPISL